MQTFIRRFRVFLLFIFLLFLCLYVLLYGDLIPRDSNPVSRMILTVFSPLLEGADAISDNISQTWEEYLSIRDARRENRQLKKDISLLKGRLSEIVEYQLENERLRNLLAFKRKRAIKVVAAEVIGKDPTPFFRTILINKGSNDKLSKNMAVLTHEGVVGHLIEVAPDISKVLLISDINSSVSAIVQRNRTQGIVVGGGGVLCKIKFLSNAADIREGDLMITSGFGGVYPKGLPVGRLQNISKKTTGLFLDAILGPGANLSRLENVLVIIRQSSAP